jgi:hypothetical protein
MPMRGSPAKPLDGFGIIPHYASTIGIPRTKVILGYRMPLPSSLAVPLDGFGIIPHYA